MPRPAALFLPALLLPVLLAACAEPTPIPPFGGAPRGADGGAGRDPRLDACRAEAERVVRFRERGQLMRLDETESSRGTVTVAPFSRAESDRAAAQIDRDRIIQDCLRAAPGGGGPGGRS